jgi:maleylacetoacetate isomerase
MIVYSYWRSSASHRVRIALALKGLTPEFRFVHLVKDGGQQHGADYRALNPHGRVPFLVDGAVRLGQSQAIIEYLEETHPTPALLPKDAAGRARVRMLAATVAADIQPLQNLVTLKQLETRFGADQAAKEDWIRHWIAQGFTALERLLADGAGRYSHGDTPGMADCFLAPQVFTARRFKLDLAAFPTIARIDAACAELAAFQAAAPAAQPDAE